MKTTPEKSRANVMNLHLIACFFVLLALGCDDRSSSSSGPPASTPISATAPAGMSKYAYLAADGGPHMLLPVEAASAWKGSPSMLATLNPGSDYGRACAATANTKMAVIPVGSTSALVMQNPPMSASGISSDGLAEIYDLESWKSTNLDALIARASQATPTAAMADSGKSIRLKEPDAYLLFAGDTPASSAYGVHRVKISAGTYEVMVGTYSSNGDSLTIYRLKPLKK